MSSPFPSLVAVVATLDTKGEEARFLKEQLAGRGLDARLVDVGVLGDPPFALEPGDVSRKQVAAAAGLRVEGLAGLRRDQAMAAMGQGAARVLQGWHREGRLAGVAGLGGNQGTAVAAMAMRPLPIGTPRVLVSTVASGNLRPYVGSADIAVMFSVADFLGGLHPISRGVLLRTAGLLAGMVEASRSGGVGPGSAPAADGPGHGPAGAGVAALTALGNTQATALRVIEQLRAAGWEVVPFHASGAGGTAMEGLMRQGFFGGVVELAPHELLGELFSDDIYAPVEPGRLKVAGELGLPQVVVPGGLEYFVFGPEESIPPRFRGRPIHHHNPYNTNVLATEEEMARVGEEVGRRLSAARGPAAFVDPLRGWSQVGSPGGPLHHPRGREAFRAALLSVLDRNRVHYEALDTTINDPALADRVAQLFLELCGTRAAGRRAGSGVRAVSEGVV